MSKTEKVLYINQEKDYEKLLQKYYANGYSTSWLKGYIACLYGSLIIEDTKRYELNCLIEKLKKEEEK